MKPIRTCLIVFALVVVMSGCNSSTGESVSPFEGMQLATVSEDGSPRNTPTVVPVPGEKLFQDDFSNPATGWLIQEDEDGKTAYENGSFIVESRKEDYVTWSQTSQNFSDIRIDVDVTALNSAQNDFNGFGVDCRIQENGEGYSLYISSDGQYTILKYDGQKFTSLVEWTDSLNIPTGSKTNHLTVYCVGSHLSLWLNGIELASAEDSTYTSGDISLSAISYNEMPATIRFDNLIVSSADEQDLQ